ncbi:uncharacterized protein LOC129974402 [Argiope bruennichi]|nr:uncharacterized protein LOC129974402 [Argiope bruennichi]
MLCNKLFTQISISNCVRMIHISHTRQSTFHSRNPPEPHFDRKRMIEVCKPISVPKKIPDWQTCSQAVILEEEKAHPYETILAKELKQNWESSKMIMFYHLTSLTDRLTRDVRNMFFKKDLFFHIYSPEVVKLAVQETPFTSILHLFESKTALLFCPDQDINKVLQLSKKTPYVILMAGIVEGTFYSKSQLQSLNDALKKDVHQQLAQILDYTPSKLVGTINHHSQTLCHYLNEISSRKE